MGEGGEAHHPSRQQSQPHGARTEAEAARQVEPADEAPASAEERASPK